MAEKKKGETQVYNPKSDTWVRRDESGRFIGAQKEPFKGVHKEKEKEGK